MSQESRRRILLNETADSRTVFAMTVWSAVTLIAVALISRRLSGAFSPTISGLIPCLAATATLFVTFAAHVAWCAARRREFAGRKYVVAVSLTLLPPFVVGAALWTSGSEFVAGYLIGLLILSSLGILVTRDLALTPQRSASADLPLKSREASSAAIAQIMAPKIVGETPSSGPASAVEVDEEEPIEEDPSILQWMARRQLPDGKQLVEGSVRVFFDQGELLSIVHVPFVPPLTSRPQAECHLLSNFDGRVRVAAAQTYGLRIEARRSAGASGRAEIEIAFTAQVPAQQAQAA